MASSPITSWQIDGKAVETVTDFIFGGSKITTDGDCSHEIKTLAPWKKSYDQLATHSTILFRESCGQRSLVGCCPLGRIESDSTEATQHACMHWRRKWQPTPLFLPRESCGKRSLVGCRLWGHRVGHNWSDLAAAADSILKSRDITLPTKVHLVKAIVFPVVTYGCENWTIKKAERQRIDAFEQWC